MEAKRSTYTSSHQSSSNTSEKTTQAQKKEISRKARGHCEVSESTSHTQFFRTSIHDRVNYKRITTDEFFGKTDSLTSSDTFGCGHGTTGKQYTQKALMKRALVRKLDPIPTDKKWTKKCSPLFGWEIAEIIEFLVQDPTVGSQRERLEMHLTDLARTSSKGYRVDVLERICNIIDYLVETLPKDQSLYTILTTLLENMGKPINLLGSDITKCFDSIRHYVGFMGYLLMRLESDHHFDIISKALIWHLSAPDSVRAQSQAKLRHTLAAAAPVLRETTVRMIAMSTSHRFPTYLRIALLLACDSEENCIEFMKQNIIENIFYRFNPYFPNRDLPVYDQPGDTRDMNLILGDSSHHILTTQSLLFVLLKTTKKCILDHPNFGLLLPCPDDYSQRCFIWAFRYECRECQHQHQRLNMAVIASVLLHIFKERLFIFQNILMADVLSLAVMTELPPREDWTKFVRFNILQLDVQFKKILIALSVDFIKLFPSNYFMIESRFWLLGLAYLIDPGLCFLRTHWSPPLFAEIRKTTLQALVCTLPRMPAHLVHKYGLIRRLMWYIEWYSESPFELPILYWCVRLLQTIIHLKGSNARADSLQDLYDTHGIIILIHLSYTLLEQKLPPVERSQAIITLNLRMLTSAIEPKSKISCCVYPEIKWPQAINALAKKMLDTVLYSLDKHFLISDRWLVSLLNFIWEAVIWKPEYRAKFIANDGVYKLLDIITMTKAPVQCIALAMICDLTSAGDAVGQLITWRANLGATHAHPNVVKSGATIATLLAAIFRHECQLIGVRLSDGGVIKDLDCPIMSPELRSQIENKDIFWMRNLRSPVCYVGADVAGSRLSKVFAILHMLSEDLAYKVALADESYNLYKNIKLAPEDEAILVLSSHYLTLKLNEAWKETHVQSPGLLPADEEILDEFMHISRGWAKEIQRQQTNILEKDLKREHEEEYSLYSFLGRVRLNIALDALREVRCVARSADRARITHALIHDAVHAHHRRFKSAKMMEAPVLRTYGPTLDEDNVTGQNVKVFSIHPKNKPKARDHFYSS